MEDKEKLDVKHLLPDMRYICTTEYYSVIKKKEIMPLAVIWMELEIITLSEERQKDKYHMIITYMWNLKCDTIGHL